MNHEEAMNDQTPDIISLIDALKPWWYWIAGTGFSAVIAFFAFYRKWCHGRVVPVFIWCRNFVDMPHAVAEIKEQVHLDDGRTLKQWIAQTDDKLHALERVWLMERNRRHILFDRVPEPVAEMDMLGSLTYANPAFASLVGCTTDELLNNAWSNIIDINERATVMVAFERAQKLGDTFSVQFPLDSNGKEVRFKASVIRDGAVLVGYGISIYAVDAEK
jgi:PAS domain S-box-containing protein